MCSNGPTTSYGYPLQIASDAGLDDVPRCCRDSMTGKQLERGGIEYTCDGCHTVLELDEFGLVYDIREHTDV